MMRFNILLLLFVVGLLSSEVLAENTSSNASSGNSHQPTIFGLSRKQQKGSIVKSKTIKVDHENNQEYHRHWSFTGMEGLGCPHNKVEEVGRGQRRQQRGGFAAAAAVNNHKNKNIRKKIPGTPNNEALCGTKTCETNLYLVL